MFGLKCYFIFLFLFLFQIPTFADKLPERPIQFSLQPGFLKAKSLRNIENGWHPLLKGELHALRRTWLGYVIEFGLSRPNTNNRQKHTARFLATGPSFYHAFKTMRVEYRIGYGAFLGGGRVSTLFVHSIVGSVPLKSPWYLQAALQHFVPNDWLHNTRLDEQYGAFVFSVGGGVQF